MNKFIRIFSWVYSIFTTIFFTMFIGAYVYDIQEHTLYGEIVKASIVLWVFLSISLIITFLYREIKEWDND